MHLAVSAFLRMVDEHGEIPTVSVENKLVESRVQALEPVLAPHRLVLAAVYNLCVPGRWRHVGHPLRVQIVAKRRRVRAQQSTFHDPLFEWKTLRAAPVSILRMIYSNTVLLCQFQLLDHEERGKHQGETQQRFQQSDPLSPEKMFHGSHYGSSWLSDVVPFAFIALHKCASGFSPPQTSLLIWTPGVASKAVWHWSGPGAPFVHDGALRSQAPCGGSMQYMQSVLCVFLLPRPYVSDWRPAVQETLYLSQHPHPHPKYLLPLMIRTDLGSGFLISPSLTHLVSGHTIRVIKIEFNRLHRPMFIFFKYSSITLKQKKHIVIKLKSFKV